MKRRYMMLGLAVIVALLLLAALAGPATAKSEKWKEFTANLSLLEYLPGTEWFPGSTELSDGTIVPKQVWQTRDEYYAGQYTAWDALTGTKIDELSGYLQVYSDWRARLDKAGNLVVSYVNKSTLYVGAENAEDVGDEVWDGVWEMSAVGEQVYLAVPIEDPITGEPVYVTDHIEGVGHGISGDVKGWVLKFTGAFDLVTDGYYMEK